MHVDLMHVLYVYSRVMGPGGIVTKYSRGGQVHVCICGNLYIYKTHVHDAVYIVIIACMHAAIVMECMGIVCMKLYRGVWGQAGKIQVFRCMR